MEIRRRVRDEAQHPLSGVLLNDKVGFGFVFEAHMRGN
jgi:hypothetical protein